MRTRRRRRTFRLLRQSFHIAGVDKILSIYFVFFLVTTVILLYVEPHIKNYSDSLWYCFAVTTTVGFGDITATTAVGRILTAVLSVCSIIVVAIVTAAITSFCLDQAKLKASDSAKQFMDDLEHLSELSPEELDELSARIKQFRLTGERELDKIRKKRKGKH